MTQEPAAQPTSPETKAKKEEGPWPVHPIFVAVFPVLSVMSANLSIVPIDDLFRPLALAAAAAGLLFSLLLLILRSRNRAAAAASVILAGLWAYNELRPLVAIPMDGVFVDAGTTVAITLAAGLAAWWGPNPRVFNLVAGLAVAVSAASLAWMAAFPPTIKGDPKGVSVALPQGSSRPDIYHIILDGFGRQDSVKRAIGYDIAPFVAALKHRGFQVVEKARTTYVQTELSITSTLNMDTIQDLLPGVPTDQSDRRILDPLLKKSRVVEALKSVGYRSLAVTTGFGGLDFGRISLPSLRGGGLTQFEGVLLAKLPGGDQTEWGKSLQRVHRRNIVEAFRQIAGLAAPTGIPRHVIAHILSPHPPFVIGAEGEEIRQKGPFGYWDGSDYMVYVGNKESYQKGYSAKAAFTCDQLLQVIDKILEAHGENEPIIVLHGDHGSKVGLDQNSLAKTDINEAFPILYAIHAPPALGLKLPPDDSPINLYPRLLQAMGAKGISLNPGTSWYSPYGKPFEFVDVTDQIR